MSSPTSTPSPTEAHFSATMCYTYYDDIVFVGSLHITNVNEASLHPIERTDHRHDLRPIHVAPDICKAFDRVGRNSVTAMLSAHGILHQPQASSSYIHNKLPSPSKYEEVD